MGEPVPRLVLQYFAAQLTVDPEVYLQYAKRDTTRRQHIAKIQKLFRFRQWNREIEQVLTPFLLAFALQVENGMMLATVLLEELRKKRILLPAASTIEQFVSQMRAQAEAGECLEVRSTGRSGRC